MSDWKNVQYKDGKLRTNNGGSGGASALSDLTDVDLTNIADGQILKWDATNSKWVNANESGGGSVDADDVNYDNTTSGMTATNVQDALDEISQDFRDGCDIISQAVIAKGVTPASNSPSDIANAISQISGSSFETPSSFDYIGGYVANGTWYQPDTSTPCDIYAIANGHCYMLMLGTTVGNRFRAMTTNVDVRTSTASSVAGTQIVNSNSPSAYDYAKFVSNVNGYLIIGKNNTNTMGIKTYLLDMTSKMQ